MGCNGKMGGPGYWVRGESGAFRLRRTEFVRVKAAWMMAQGRTLNGRLVFMLTPSFQQIDQTPLAEPETLSRQAVQAFALPRIALLRLATHRLQINQNYREGVLPREAALRHKAR